MDTLRHGGTGGYQTLLGLGGALAVVTFLLYLPVGGFEFIYLDDYAYVVNNPLVQNGITGNGLLRVLTTSPVNYWLASRYLDFSYAGLRVFR
ncbi:MAG: hypothetical protein L0Y36_08290 [Planctomycetales bacterium]|nr:hypothetical protein [Planctomycetales bacterium]